MQIDSSAGYRAMAKRGISERQFHWLSAQLTDWRQADLVTADQAQGILDLYEVSSEATEQRQTWAQIALMAIAAVLVGLGILLLIGYNWGSMPPALKLAILIGGLALLQSTAVYLRFYRRAHILSEVAFFLGCLIFGFAIFLIAQIFHVNVHYPDGVWWWAIGVLPFALALDSLLLHVLLVALLALWAGIDVLGFRESEVWAFEPSRYLSGHAMTLPLLAAPGFFWAYRRSSPAAVSLYVPLIVWWIVLQPLGSQLFHGIPQYIGATGGLLLLVAASHPAGNRFAIPYRLYGALMIGGTLFAMSFYRLNAHDLYPPRGDTNLDLLPILLIAIATLGTLAVAANNARRQNPGARGWVYVDKKLVGQLGLPLAFVVGMTALFLWRHSTIDPWLVTIASNAGMVALAIWLISVGLKEDRGRPFTAGILYFLIWAVARYIDLFGNFGGMLGAALMFFGCGGVLFGVAAFWRRRKQQHG